MARQVPLSFFSSAIIAPRSAANASKRPQLRHFVFSKKTSAWQALQWKVFKGSLLARLFRIVPNRFDIVAVRVQYERRVVAGRIVPIARSAVVLAPGRQRSLEKGLHLCAPVGAKCEVSGDDPLLLGDPKIRILAVIEA